MSWTEKDKKIMNRLQEHLDVVQKTYQNKWFVICLQGSQNYGMDDEESDIDSKCLIIPTFEQLIYNKPAISHTLVMDNNEHCDVKDVREYFKIVRKSNINFVEIFFTKWYIVNPKYKSIWKSLLNNKELIVRINPYAAFSAIRGMALQKYHALEHEYPSRMHIIEKFGYDPKQLSHLIRIRYFIQQYLFEKPYEECINLKNSMIKKMLLDTKRNGWNEEQSGFTYKQIADVTLETINKIADRGRELYPNKNDPQAEDVLDNALEKLMRKTLREELL